ncbi:MAG: xanthine dehydrogenase family protein molybdopterin-binding subunit, partial [Candidatus Bathyarchaeia archaeon]
MDATRAEELGGVKAILTWKDVPRIKYNSGDKNPPVPDAFVPDQYLLDEKVRFVGDVVAFVAATSEETAEKALELVDVEYERLPAVFDAEEAMKPGAPGIHEDREGNIAAEIPIKIGNVEKGFSESDYVLEEKYELPIQHPYPIEPHTSVAGFDETGKLTVWSSTQIPFVLRAQLSRLLNMPVGKIRILAPYVGGAFGAKQDMITEPIAALLTLKTGRPVKIQLTAEEMFYASRTRHSGTIYLKTGVRNDGTLLSRYCKVVFNTGAYASHGPSVTSFAGWCFTLLYRAPNIHFDGYTIYTNIPVAGAFRGYGNPQVTFAMESHMDTIAEKLSMDPLDFRLMNAHRKGDVDPILGYVTSTCGLAECIRKGAAKVEWDMKRKA